MLNFGKSTFGLSTVQPQQPAHRLRSRFQIAKLIAGPLAARARRAIDDNTLASRDRREQQWLQLCNDARDEVDVDDRRALEFRMLLDRKHVMIDHLDEVAAAGALVRIA